MIAPKCLTWRRLLLMTGRTWNSLLLTVFEGGHAGCAGVRNVGRHSKHFFSQRKLTMKRLHCALLGTLLLTAFAATASAATIYRETFGRPPSGSPGTTTTNI